MNLNFVVKSVSTVDKIFFIKNLGLMVKTGFSLADALASLKDQTKNKLFRTTLISVHSDVTAGESLANALRKHPSVFESLFINMVSAGEQSGNLDKTLDHLALQLKKSYELKRKIRNAMIYPVLIFSVMIVVGIGMFTFVVPRILELYSANSYSLPLPTQIILTISTFLRDQALYVALVSVALVMVAVIIWRNPAGRRLCDKLILRLPIVGKIVKKVMIAKFMRLLNSLITTDIPIVKSFQIISPTLGNTSYADYALSSISQLSKGSTINSTMFARPQLFEGVITQMIRVGEESGQLDIITQEIADFYEDDVDSVMSNLAVIIEPVLMIVMGVGVAFLAVAILLPIYGLVNEI